MALYISNAESTPPLLLSVSSNSRYLVDQNGKVVFLAGSNYWNAIQDGGRDNPPAVFNFNDWITFLVARGLNYANSHTWEHAWHQSYADDWYIAPQIYSRPGPGTALDGGDKFDVTSFNAGYFDRLRARAIAYGQNGIYVAIELFNRFSLRDGGIMTDQWLGHSYNFNNNINSINGDPDANGNGLDTETLYISAITSLQEAYIEHLVDTLNDLDNIIWEVAMEPYGTWVSAGDDTPDTWVDYMINHLRTYEATKPKQHVILQGVGSPAGVCDNTYVFGCDADVVMPNGGDSNEFDHDCPYLDGTKVVLINTDHIAWTEQDTAEWSWKSFLRGAGGFTIMDGGYSDYDDQGGGADFAGTENGRYNLGKILEYASIVDLINMLPQNGGTDPCEMGYCLYKTGEYLCWNGGHDTAFDLDLTGDIGTFDLEWYRLSDLSSVSGGTVAGNGVRALSSPEDDHYIAYLKVQA